MKAMKYLFLAAATCFALTSCLDGDDSLLNDDWKDPTIEQAPFGNNAINEENVITIAELKAHPNYKTAIANSGNKLVEDDLKLRVFVTGNDIGGNLYKQFAVQDQTGALIVAVNEGGLSGFLPEGQQIIIDLKGLYIGGYGSQIELGTPYNGQIGRMPKDLWNAHFKIIGQPDPNAIQPYDFTQIMNDMATYCGSLVTLKNVTFKSANGKKTFVDGAQSGGNYFTQQIDGYSSSKLIIRTSSYADFAATVLPYDSVAMQKIPCNITGIATRYRDTWQIMLRKSSDLEILR